MNARISLSLVAAAAALSSSCDSNHPTQASTNRVAGSQRADRVSELPLILERVTLSLSNTSGTVTAMTFHRTTPPPWNTGNSLGFRKIHPRQPGCEEEQAVWSIVNIHAENLFEIKRRLGMDVIELQVLHHRYPTEIQETGRPARKIVLDQGQAIIIDRRIPNEWLVFEPKCDRAIGRRLKTQYPDAFRKTE